MGDLRDPEFNAETPEAGIAYPVDQVFHRRVQAAGVAAVVGIVRDELRNACGRRAVEKREVSRPGEGSDGNIRRASAAEAAAVVVEVDGVVGKERTGWHRHPAALAINDEGVDEGASIWARAHGEVVAPRQADLRMAGESCLEDDARRVA